MATEKLDQISDEELFSEAVAPDPEPKVEAKEPEAEKPEVEAETEEAKEERERDDKGRFVAKEDKEEPAPEQPIEQPKEEKPESIPSWRLKEEAEAKREALQRAEAAEREREQVRQQLWALQQKVQQSQQPPEPIDIFADPQGYQASVTQTMEQRMRAMEGNFSLRLAAHRHGETFTQAWSDMVSRTQNGDDTMRQQVLNSPDPGETLVQLYQREQVVKEVGSDPTAYRTKVLEDALKNPEFLAKALEAAKANAGTRPAQQKIDLPPSLNKATAAAKATDEDDASDAGIYAYATR